MKTLLIIIIVLAVVCLFSPSLFARGHGHFGGHFGGYGGFGFRSPSFGFGHGYIRSWRGPSWGIRPGIRPWGGYRPYYYSPYYYPRPYYGDECWITGYLDPYTGYWIPGYWGSCW